MTTTPSTLKTLIQQELGHVTDGRVLVHVKAMLIEPNVVLRDWDYGDPGQQFPCWNVLCHSNSNTGVAYCEKGFGPYMPWGLVWLGDPAHPHFSIGMDSSWFPTFLDAYFDSFAVTELPIWRVMKNGVCGHGELITCEDTWEETWKRVAELREADPCSRYDCRHGITFKSERS
jgi:hypothetical protein